MRKIIAISIMFILLAGVAFAADVSGSVIGTVTLLQDKTIPDPEDATKELSKVVSSFGMNQLRIEASGQDETGVFGGWLRLEGGFNGLVWWKPIDQLKLTIGGNPDGHFGKDGVTRWMFYQSASDTGVTTVGNAWGGGYGSDCYGVYGNAFWGGAAPGFMLEITPMDMLGINIAIPFNAGQIVEDEKTKKYVGEGVGDAFKQAIVQFDLKLDFGNIALTYVGGLGDSIDGFDDFFSDDDDDKDKDPSAGYPNLGGGNGGKIYLYAGIPVGENLALDIGIGYSLASKIDFGGLASITYNPPIYAGLGLKFSSDAFGVKVRTVAGFGGKASVSFLGTTEDQDLPFTLRFDALPFFTLSDTMRAYVSVGIGYIGEMTNKDYTISDSFMDWHFNPYLEIGQEWGPKFLFGIKVWSDKTFKFNEKGTVVEDKSNVHWAVPIALMVSF